MIAHAESSAVLVWLLDALHLATALLFREAHGTLTLLSLDERVRENGASLGLAVAP